MGLPEIFITLKNEDKYLFKEDTKCRTMKALKHLYETGEPHKIVVHPSSTNLKPSSSLARNRIRQKCLIHVTDFEAGGKKQIKSEEFFCGYLPESEVLKRLIKDGDFMVRRAPRNGVDMYVLSYKVSGVVRHRPIMFNESHRLYYMQTYGFDSISGLVAYHVNKSVAVDELGGKILHGVQRDSWQLYHAQIEKLKKLGSGAFGEVWLCSMQTGLFTSLEVAVKVCSLTESNAAEENEKLFMEAQTMLQLSHPNIVKLMGVAMYEQPIMIVLELCPGGSVLDALLAKDQTVEQRHRYIVGSAKGMAYLEANQIIHRDIAARNILIGRNGEPKISDFGLSIFGSNYRVKCLKKVPIRYLAPETMKKGRFSIKSDVFSFGVFVWEVWQNGKQPWEEIEDLKKISTLITSGRRLANDNDLIPPDFWRLCEWCWNQSPEDRPTFSQIVVSLGKYDVKINRDDKLERILRWAKVI